MHVPWHGIIRTSLVAAAPLCWREKRAWTRIEAAEHLDHQVVSSCFFCAANCTFEFPKELEPEQVRGDENQCLELQGWRRLEAYAYRAVSWISDAGSANYREERNNADSPLHECAPVDRCQPASWHPNHQHVSSLTRCTIRFFMDHTPRYAKVFPRKILLCFPSTWTACCPGTRSLAPTLQITPPPLQRSSTPPLPSPGNVRSKCAVKACDASLMQNDPFRNIGCCF